MKARHLGAFLAGSLLALSALSPLSARAELTPEARATAASFFEAGAQAFDAGKYLVAAEAFLKAHELLKSPALLFSAAQAYRRHYVTETSPDALRLAVQLYREYLRVDPAGKRREDAVLALTDLAPLEARLGARQTLSAQGGAGDPGGKPGLIPIDVPIFGGAGSGGAGTSAPAAPGNGAAGSAPGTDTGSPRSTRLLLSAKPSSAEVSVDGGAFVGVPAVVVVKGGPRAVRVRAEGYFDEELTVPALPNELVPLHIVMRPKPGRLLVTGTAGARVSIDGQVRAVLPMERPLDVEPGEHFITVARSGRVSFGKSIPIERSKETPLAADLPFTGQRIAAWTTFGVGLAGAAVGGVLFGLMADRDAAAAELEARRTSGTLTAPERDDYNTALNIRNDFALAAGATGGAAALVLLASAGLFLFDEPDALPIPARGADKDPPSVRTELTVGLASARLRISF